MLFRSTKNPFPTKNPWSPPKSLNTIMLPSYSGLCQIVPICLVVPRSTEVCIAVRNLFIGKSNGNFSNNNNKKERVTLNSSSVLDDTLEDTMFGDGSTRNSSISRNSSQKNLNKLQNSHVIGVLIPDEEQNPSQIFAQKPIGFTFMKGPDPSVLIWRGDLVAGTYRLCRLSPECAVHHGAARGPAECSAWPGARDGARPRPLPGSLPLHDRR